MSRAEETGKDAARREGRAISNPVENGVDAASAYENEREPLSLAEELVREGKASRSDAQDYYEKIKQTGDTHIAQLQQMSMGELIAEARAGDLDEVAGMKKHDLVFQILRERVKLNGLMFGEGTLEVLPDGFGFLRSPDYHYLSCPDDIYVSPSQIRRFGLKTGATVSGQIRPPKENERYFALLRVEAINYEDPNLVSSKISFEELTPLHPDSRIVVETDADEIDMRVVVRFVSGPDGELLPAFERLSRPPQTTQLTRPHLAPVVFGRPKARYT